MGNPHQHECTNIPMHLLSRCPIEMRPVCKETLEYVMLADSIKKRGVLTPIMVRPVGDAYEVVLGMHRYEAALAARLESVPVVIRECSDEEVKDYQIEENLHVVPTKKIHYIRRILDRIRDGETTIDEYAHSISKHPDTIKNWLSLNLLSTKWKVLLDSGRLSGILGVELAKLPVPKQDELLSLHSQLLAGEFLEEIRLQVRKHRGMKRVERGKQLAGLQPSCRQWKEIYNELTSPTEKAIVLTRAGATNASEGWDACMEWISSMDSETLAIREKRKERKAAKAERETNLLKLEITNRRSTYEQ